jgi:hypothetical protein
MHLLVFLHGTAIMHRGAVGRTRAERVAQACSGADPTVRDFASYVPVDGVVAKLRRWEDEGCRIDYLTSHRDPMDIAKDAGVLQRHGFPLGRILAREPGESYADVVRREVPDVLIEDDCESIGDPAEITYQQMGPDLRARVKSIVVPEFGGIDHLPDSLAALPAFEP